MRTTSVMIQSLCVPCHNRCRYCLLSWDGRTEGAPWDRSAALAERWLKELRDALPGISAGFSFGYSMEHPDLRRAIRTLRRLGSPTADFLQCDGMEMRDADGCAALMRMLREEGVRQLGFTVYGLSAYHDRFAGRSGDYDLLLRMMRAAGEAGIPFRTGIPVTGENVGQIDELADILRRAGSGGVSLFIPHEEGRGRLLGKVRLRRQELSRLSPGSLELLNRRVYRTESEWLAEPDPAREETRMILISLREDTLERDEARSALSALREIEALDDAYYAAFPPFSALAGLYGDPGGDRLYRIRDLYSHYRTLYARDHGLQIYDVTDERRSGSRRS